MSTKLLYLEDMQKLTCRAYVEEVQIKDGKTVLILDQTVFYPQGGGQPYDVGVITAGISKFLVEEVRFIEGEVQHIGRFESQMIMQGEEVECFVEASRRALNTRLHSAGHVLDMAVYELGYDWTPGKGYHFPDGPYVEYQADISEGDLEEIIQKLNLRITEILGRDIESEIRFMPKEEMANYCRHVPDFLPAGKPSRIVLYDKFGVPCGGTHVARLADIGTESVRKIKLKGQNVKISYMIA